MPKRAPKRARDDVVKKNEEAPAAANSLMTALMRRGSVSVLEALEVELPEVLKTEVIKKHLPLDATLNLAQVSKWCRDAVWSPETVHKWHRTKRSYVLDTLAVTCVRQSPRDGCALRQPSCDQSHD
jgi:hypothetical protein